MAGVLAGAGVDARNRFAYWRIRVCEKSSTVTSIRPRKRNYDAHMAGSITGMMAARALQIATTETSRFWRA